MTPAEFEDILAELPEELRVEALNRYSSRKAAPDVSLECRRQEMRSIVYDVAHDARNHSRNPGSPNGPGLQRVAYSKIPRRKVSWLWRGYFPFGKHVMLEGDPDVGKSTLTVDIAARVTTGASMPDGTPGCEPAGVLILSAEDDPEDTIGPRLMAAGADMSKVYYARFTLNGAEREPTICEEDIALIEEAMSLYGIRLVIIDPMTAYLDGNVRVYVDHDVRRALRPLKGLAERAGCALLVIRHWTKAPNANAQHRGGGSVGITAAARGVLSIGFDPDDKNPDHNQRKRVLSVAKMNVGAPSPAREFHLEYVEAHDACRIVWGGVSKHTANSLSAGPGPQKDSSALEDAKDFLFERVTTGGVPVAPLQTEAKEMGIAQITLRRAKKELGIEAYTGPNGPPWYWRLPAGAHTRTDDHLSKSGGGQVDHLRERAHLPGLGGAADSGVEP